MSTRKRLLTGTGLAVIAVLVFAAPARAAKYAVAQCGDSAGVDAEWLDSTGGRGFGHEAPCKSFVRGGAGSLPAGALAHWRWVAAPGTAITAVRGIWWQTLHGSFQHRLGSGTPGGFEELARSANTAAPSGFVARLRAPGHSFESRLLCARASGRCEARPVSFAAVRAAVLTLEDPSRPRPTAGGDLLAGGWRRGGQELAYSATDAGSGLRFSEMLIDGRRAALVEHPCRKTIIDGALHATAMRPCALRQSGVQQLDTARLSDGRHRIRSCAEDFARNRACTEPREVSIDNTAPGGPIGLAVLGGDAWRRVNSFDLAWRNPDQGPGSEIAAAGYRITGPGGFDSGVHYAQGHRIGSLHDLTVPASGAYTAEVWLRDEAGNEAPAEGASATLRLDQEAPSVAFAPRQDRRRPELVRALLGDEHSGPAGGRILFRPLGRGRWRPLPTRLVSGSPGTAELRAHFPGERVAPGRYALRAEAADVAGNHALSGRRQGGAPMILRAPLRRRAVTVILRVSPRRIVTGETVRFSGRVIAPDQAAPLRGRTVQLQYLERETHRWRLALLVRTGASGRFARQYRFRHITGLARIRLRAVLVAQPGWPYAAGASPPIELTVRG
jgi:hypothetical protein